MKIWKASMLLLVIVSVFFSNAYADGSGQWVNSRLNGYIPFASYVQEYDGWQDAEGIGGITSADRYKVRVISKNASVWAQPRTNRKKLGSVSNGDELFVIPVETEYLQYQREITEENGFYAVRYSGQDGWINSVYVVYAPYEIVLMESNVPAYGVPDEAAKRVGSLNKLTRYTVIGFYDDFYVVNLRQAAAFIPMNVRHYDTRFESWYHAGFHTKLTVTKSTVLRTGPGDDYAKVRDIKPGSVFDCWDEIDGWYLVSDAENGAFTYIWSGDARTE